jgi:hypothetical protein
MTPTSFIFVAQAGHLEKMSLVLAASLRANAGFNHELIAAVPTPASIWGSLSTGVKAAFEELEVAVKEITNPFGRKYPIGNKFGCLMVEPRHRRLVFLDTDVIMLRAPQNDSLEQGRIAAVPASGSHHTDDEWRKIYAAVRLPVPRVEPPNGTMSPRMPPYFNAGMVSVDPDANFGSVWLECAQKIEQNQSIPFKAKRPWLDQIALPVAAAMLGIDVCALSVEYNFPSWVRSIRPSENTVFYHYQSPLVLLRNREMFGHASRAVSSYPATRKELRKYRKFAMLCSSRNYFAKKFFYRRVRPKFVRRK